MLSTMNFNTPLKRKRQMLRLSNPVQSDSFFKTDVTEGETAIKTFFSFFCVVIFWVKVVIDIKMRRVHDSEGIKATLNRCQLTAV